MKYTLAHAFYIKSPISDFSRRKPGDEAIWENYCIGNLSHLAFVTCSIIIKGKRLASV